MAWCLIKRSMCLHGVMLG